MNRPNKIRFLARMFNLETEHQQLNIALTHRSFYKNGKDEKSNSRFVFIGMFAFKGEVASYMSQFVPGTGMQLQHALGNLFRNETLLKIFDSFRLKEVIRYGNDFDAENHTHIFVYAFLGFLYKYLSDNDLNKFISQNIILPNYKFIDFSGKSKDLEAQCNVIAKILFGCKVKTETEKWNEKEFVTTVSISEYIVSKETAGGYRYSRTKSLKKTLKKLSEDMFFIESQKPDFMLKINRIEQLQEEKIKHQKEEKLRLQAEKEERKRQENAIKKQKRIEEKAKLDLARRKAKADAKLKKESRKGKNTIYRAYSAEEIASMNAAKRRRLEDLGILSKQK